MPDIRHIEIELSLRA